MQFKTLDHADLFSHELGLEPCPDLDVRLQNLAARHRFLSKSSVNRLGK